MVPYLGLKKGANKIKLFDAYFEMSSMSQKHFLGTEGGRRRPFIF
jgi:hypothetical protein